MAPETTAQPYDNRKYLNGDVLSTEKEGEEAAIREKIAGRIREYPEGFIVLAMA